MIGKPIKGKSFGGCIRYVVDKIDAQILYAEGVRTQSVQTLIQDFNFQRRLNPELGKAVGHTVLSWSQQDQSKLTDKLMVEIACKYLKEMSIAETQCLIVKHTDRQHPHVHIIFNRVDNAGKTITDKSDFLRNTKACRKLTEAYGLHIAEGKAQVKRERLKGGDQLKYEIYDALKSALRHARSWPELERNLRQNNISVLFKHKSGTNEVQGVSFEKDGVVFKGSAIDRSMSLIGIEKQLRKKAFTNITLKSDDLAGAKPQLLEEKDIVFNTGIQLTTEIASLLSGWFDFYPTSEQEPTLWEEERRRRRKRKRKI